MAAITPETKTDTIWRFLFLLGTYGPLVGAFSGQRPGLLDLAGDDADADAE